MDVDRYDHLLELSDRDLVEMRDARGTTLRVVQGTVWLTQDGDTRDIVLRAGDGWTIERGGLSLIEAQGHARISLVGRRGATARAHRMGRALGQRLRAGLGALLRALPRPRIVPYY